MEEIRRERNYETYGNKSIPIAHKCVMQDRNKLEMTGVNEVNSFDANEILLDTKLGGALIKGEELHIGQLNLDKGNVDVHGKINAIVYTDKNIAQPTVKEIWTRIFR